MITKHLGVGQEECFALWEECVYRAFSYATLLESRYLPIKFEKIIEGDGLEILKLEEFLGVGIREKLLSAIDSSRSRSYDNGDYSEVLNLAKESDLMTKLDYL